MKRLVQLDAPYEAPWRCDVCLRAVAMDGNNDARHEVDYSPVCDVPNSSGLTNEERCT